MAYVLWVLLQGDGSQWALVTQKVQHMSGFLPWIMFGRPALLTQRVVLDVCRYYAAVQNLVYGCGNISQTSAECSNSPPIHYAIHLQYISIQLPAGLQCDPVQMAEVVQQEYDAQCAILPI